MGVWEPWYIGLRGTVGLGWCSGYWASLRTRAGERLLRESVPGECELRELELCALVQTGASMFYLMCS